MKQGCYRCWGWQPCYRDLTVGYKINLSKNISSRLALNFTCIKGVKNKVGFVLPRYLMFGKVTKYDVYCTLSINEYFLTYFRDSILIYTPYAKFY